MGPIPDILVVDDERFLLDVLSRVLPDYGFSVATAASGPEAVEALRRHGAGVALVDLCMPGMGGLATIAALREVAPSLPCCLMFGGEPPEEVDAAEVTLALQKPFSFGVLAGKLRALLGHSPPP